MKATLLAAAALSLASVSAFGADLEMPIKAPLVPAPFTWTGCYGGGQVGGGWGQKDLNDSVGIVSSISDFTSANLQHQRLHARRPNRMRLPIHAQLGNWRRRRAPSGNTVAAPASPHRTCRRQRDLQGNDRSTDQRHRTRRLSLNNWLFYGKGGAAWASDRYSALDAMATYDFEGLETRFGWTAGAGLESAVSDIWSVRLEFDYYGFGTRSMTFIDDVSGTVGPLDIEQSIQVVKVGFNFHPFAG